jgi:hypothetical protein
MTAHIEASVMRASLASAPLIVAALESALAYSGYNISLYGSVLKYGEGRDFDFFLWPHRLSPRPAMPEAMKELLEQAGFAPLEFGYGVLGYYSLLCTFQGFAIDITIKETF